MIVVTFKSKEEFYEKEKYGDKPNTVRIINSEISDERIRALKSSNPPKYIRIVNSENPTKSFKRKINDISFWQNMVIISWEHDARNFEDILK